MLRDLILRDWTLNRRGLLAMCAIFAAFQVYFVLRVDSPRFWLLATCLYASFLTVIPFTREDKFGSAGWTCTLPVTRPRIVLARFVEAWLLVLGWLGVSFLMAALIPGSRIALGSLGDAGTILAAASAVTLFLSLWLPFTIRFGLLGLLIVAVGAQVLGTVALAVTVTLSRAAKTSVAEVIGAVVAALRSALAILHAAMPPAGFYLLVVAVLAGLHAASYLGAVALFRRREF